MIGFSVTEVIINSATDNFRPNISGEFYLSLFLTHIIFIKEQLRWFVYFYIQDNHSLYTMGMEHGLTIFRPAIVRNILPDEWTRTSRHPYGPVYIN